MFLYSLSGQHVESYGLPAFGNSNFLGSLSSFADMEILLKFINMGLLFAFVSSLFANKKKLKFQRAFHFRNFELALYSVAPKLLHF